ncbi:alpha-amylase family glycosyl hydrolase [Streptobacillus moniliformis]|uniref:alpha-amylase family glycosyl hydrolase n=1 Tax=Streptobacillus moniliformis TaxID=34105 RepID=UPI0007E42FE3|nr:alpha-amylase family glycosyl hydrolase [Streptobacillus moniliformis]
MKKSILTLIAVFTLIFSCNKFKEHENTHDDKIAKTGIYYEIFVRSFADSNGDGIGDLNGIRAKLPELKDLGIEGIWLTPIFSSPSYHKYDVIDYYNIDAEYGDIEDFKKLVKASHQLGIKVIIDLPINHTSSEHPWFKDVLVDKNSKYRKFYRIEKNNNEKIDFKSAPLGGRAWHNLNDEEKYFGIFWSGMPDLNLREKEVRKEIHKISKYWINEVGIDGYRIDAAPHAYGKGEYSKDVNLLEENIKWWSEFRDELVKIKKDVYIVGEVWTAPEIVSKYFTVFDSNFNFEFSEKGIINALIRESSKELSSKLTRVYNLYEKSNKEYIDATFLTNHDQSRLSEKLSDLERQKVAASILLTLPGNPYIYYGEELGMRGKKPDELIREPYIWNDEFQTRWEPVELNIETKDYYSQKMDSNSLLNHYKLWIKIRKENDELKYGKFEAVETGNNKVFVYKMKYKRSEKILMHNLSNNEQKVILYGKEIILNPYESKIK